MDRRNKIRSIEGIRGIACLMVLFSHLSLTFFPYLHSFSLEADSNYSVQKMFHDSPFGFIYSGTSAVFIFFVLSGYILTHVASRADGPNLLAMSLKRYPRLMIPAVVSCVLSYTFFTLFSVDKTMLTSWINTYGDFDYSFFGAIYSGVVDAFIVGRSRYNPILWTMKIELIGSFLVFYICFLKLKKKVANLGRIFIVLLLAMMWLDIVSELMGLSVMAFIIGSLFCFYGRKVRPEFSIVLFLLGLYLAGIHNDSASYSFITSILGPEAYQRGNFASGILIVYSIMFNDQLNWFFAHKLFVFMGRVSFSVYLIHLPVISTLGVSLFNLASKSFSYEMSAVFSSIVVIFSTYLMAMVYYNYVDRSGMVISNKFQHFILARNRLEIQLEKPMDAQ